MSPKRYLETRSGAKSIKFKNVKLQEVFNHVEKEAENDETGKATPVKKELFTPEQRQTRILVLYQGKPYFNRYCMGINQTNRHVALAVEVTC